MKAMYKHVCSACYNQFGSSSKERRICPDCLNAICKWQPIIEFLEKNDITHSNFLFEYREQLIQLSEYQEEYPNEENDKLIDAINKEIFDGDSSINLISLRGDYYINI